MIKKSGGIVVARSDNKKVLYQGDKIPMPSSNVLHGYAGGDCGLIAQGCSMLGIGTVMGEAMKLSANYGGIYAYKPSQTRTPHLGLSTFMEENGSKNENQKFVGPISQTCSDVVTLAELMLTPSQSE